MNILQDEESQEAHSFSLEYLSFEQMCLCLKRVALFVEFIAIMFLQPDGCLSFRSLVLFHCLVYCTGLLCASLAFIHSVFL